MSGEANGNNQIILGWVLGVAGTLVAERVKNHWAVHSFRKGLKIECQRLRHRGVATHFSVQHSMQAFSWADVLWMKEQLSTLPLSADDPLVLGVNRFSALGQAGFNASLQASAAHAQPQAGVAIPTFSTPYLDSRMDLVPELYSDEQAALFDIKRAAEIINSKISLIAAWDQMSFSQNSPSNHAAIVSNSKACAAIVVVQLRIIAENCSKFERGPV